MQQTYNLFENLSNDSKVWLYLAERKLSNGEVEHISAVLEEFNATWSAHGKKLNSATNVLFNQCIVLAVDESTEIASGCSIDSSVKVLKSLSSTLNVDFFNRMNVLVYNEAQFQMFPYSAIRKNNGLFYLNPLVTKLADLRNNWLIES
jgi:hypothetical protein